ncbi:LemA family protein [Acinetobacter sp. HY1485]|uniref:LemA family protein n=1 Tax=Acinetobacter sp. HY1485 TaxID=2970918 RepID=UPI0022B99F8D|nr:LemA family protein [Acinetobacter sp. HY1485]
MLIFIGLIVALIVWSIYIRNTIVKHLNATQRSWSDVTNFELKKVRTLEQLEEKLQQYTQFEQHTLTQITALRQQIMNLNLSRTDTSQLQHVEQLNHDVMHKLNMVVENYPELKADQVYLTMMHEIQQQNDNVAASLSIFNRNVEFFNNQIQVFPNNIINTLTLSKRPIRPFRDPVMNQNFQYRPNFH